MIHENDMQDFMRGVVQDLKPILQQGLLDNFVSEGHNSGRPWAQLKASTVRRRGSAHPILVRSGRLRLGVSSARCEYKNNQIEMTVADPEYAVYHQTGTRRMIARPPLGLSQEMVSDVAEEMGEAMKDWLKERGYEADVEVTR